MQKKTKQFLSYEYPNSSQNLVILHLPAYEDGTDRVFRNVGI